MTNLTDTFGADISVAEGTLCAPLEEGEACLSAREADLQQKG